MLDVFADRRRGHGTLFVLMCVVVIGWSATISFAAEPLAPQQFSVEAVQGNAVTLSWANPAGAPPDSYLLEGGVLPGEVLASVPLPGGISTVTLPALTGAFYIRLYAVTAGVRSAASNEIRVFVNVPETPEAPSDFSGLALGSDVVLTWRNPAGPFERIVLDVSGPLSGSVPIDASGTLRVAGVPNGVYTLSVRAVNAVGSSVAATPITLTLPGGSVATKRGPAQAADAQRLPVRLERLTTPRLELLRHREHLDEAVAGATSEFETVMKLKEWVAAQFPIGDPSPYPPWDALVILDWIRAGITGGFCGQYSQVMLQSLAAMGLPARYIEIGPRENPMAHFVVETWSNDFDKWMVLDADFNVHFEHDGVPQSAVEIHDLLMADRAEELVVVQGSVRDGHPSPFEHPLGTAELYYYVRYHLNANHLSAPDEPVFDRFDDMVDWADSRMEPLNPGDVQLTRERTSNRALVDGRLNQVWATPRLAGPTQVAVDLQTNMLDFGWFEYRRLDNDGAPGPWVVHFSSTILWQVAASDRDLEIRAVNVRAMPGPATIVGVAAP